MLKLREIKRVSGETKSLKGYYSGIYLQLNVDKKTGEVWTNLHNSFGHNSWTTYRDEDVVVCGNIDTPKTMQEIRDIVYETLSYYE